MHSLQAEAGCHFGHAEPMGVENIVVAAVTVDEGVLQRERIDPAGGIGVPGQFLHAHREAAVRRAFLDDDDLGVAFRISTSAARSSGFNVWTETIAVLFAGRFKSLGKRKGAFHDRAV